MASPSLSAEDYVISHDPDHRHPVSQSEAREILEEIREEKGFLDDDNISDLAKVNPRTKGKVDKIMINYRREQAKSTRKYNKPTLEARQMLMRDRTAEDLYSTKFRLIYELLQNADDASHASGERPCVIFNAYPDRLVVETNEDGFSIANVRAICRTGESSKSASRQGKPIGEKGYGFKSVFAIAHHVRIQSGFWSFYFEHHEGEDGMGMITPLEIAPETLPSGITTRITLTLRSEPDDISVRLIEELKALPDTVTLFLQKIVQLDFNVHFPGRSTVSTSISAGIDEDYSESKKLVVTEKTTMTDQGKGSIMEDTSRKRYMLFRKSLTPMPFEKRRSGIKESIVEVAFPLRSDRFQPLISKRGQYVSAFLPMCRVAQLPFLIQADFVTLASRESVTECKWNQTLLDGIAQTFSIAIESFYDDEELRYRWMRYMPGLHLDGFWERLREKIQRRLANLNILESWLHRTPAPISQLKIVPEKYTQDGKPLFDDSDNETYLSPNYEVEDLATLRGLGVKTMTSKDFLRRLRHDTSLPMCKKDPEDLWHTSLYSTLLDILNDPKEAELHGRIAGLEIIPLRKELEVGESLDKIGENDHPIWVCASTIRDSPINFPHSKIDPLPGDFLGGLESFPIPNGVSGPLRIIWPPAVVNPQRKAFFSKIGVLDIDPIQVVDGIEEFHESWPEREPPPSLATIIPHLQYLFRFCTSEETLSKRCNFNWITDDLTSLVVNWPDYTPLYFKSKVKYSTWGLLEKTSKKVRKRYAKFIHDDIVNAETEQVLCRGRSWYRWLEESGPITTVPVLCNLENETQLSPILLYVLKHQTEKFLPVLKAHWNSTYKHDATETAAIKATIATTKVLCRNGQLEDLCQTYLPLEDIEEEAIRIGLSQELPLLDLSTTLNASNRRDWKFLLKFGVKSQINLSFYIQALDILRTFEVKDKRIFPAVSKIYGSIGKMCNLNMQSDLKTSFLSHRRIYTPNPPIYISDQIVEWQAPKDCLWEAPSWLHTKASLAESYHDDPGILRLFRIHLDIPDADYRDYLEQLAWWRDNEPEPSYMVADCLQVYNEFVTPSDVKLDMDWNEIRATFEKERLVLANGKWHAPSTCLWSSGIALSDKVTIADLYGNTKVMSSYGDYGDFEPFFVGRLGIQTADTAMIIDELIGRTKGRNPLTSEEAQCIIREIARMMGSERIDKKLEASFRRMRHAKCLPVRVGQNDPSLEDASAEFVIADHERYNKAFRPKAAFLDFTLDEVQLLHPLIKVLGLHGRYLSQNVRETSVIIGDPDRNVALTTELQARAYAFYCCAIKYKSSEVLGHDQSLYRKLEHAQVFHTDGMRTSMILFQHKKKIEVASKRAQLTFDDFANMHKLGSNPDSVNEESGKTIETDPHDSEGDDEVDEPLTPEDSDDTSALQKSAIQNLENGNGNGLQGIKIFVPADTCERRICYRTQLPGAILSILGIKDTMALLPINRLLNMQNELLSESSILEEHDIPQVSWVTPPETFFVSSAASSGTRALESLNDVWTVSESNSTSSTPPESCPEDERTHKARAVRSVRSGSARENEKKYLQLLGLIIAQVSKTYTATDSGTTIHWNVDDWLDDFPDSVDVARQLSKDDIFGVRSEGQFAHDMRIGAAGELFVFETLLRVDPEGFGQENWESSIRHLVKIHPKYKDMERKTRIEDADIIYVDTKGHLLDWLLQQNPIGIEDWLCEPTEEPRKYFIEVKTTTKGRDEIFHMSRRQYDRMYSMRKQRRKMPQDVYVIFRVYDLLSEKISMSIYVSPWRTKDATDPILRFDVKGYEVRPVE